MKHILVIAVLCLIQSIASATAAKRPYYIETTPTGLILYPGSIAVPLDQLTKAPNSMVDHILDSVQANATNEYVVVLVLPGSESSYRILRKMIGVRRIDVGYEAVDPDLKPKWDGNFTAGRFVDKNGTELFIYKTKPRATETEREAIFYECRNNQVFCVNKSALDIRLTNILSSLQANIPRNDASGLAKAILSQKITNEFYTVNTSYLMSGVMALEALPNVKGENILQLDDVGGKYRTALNRYDQHKQFIAFLVRSDSFVAFRAARNIAEKRGFVTGWELLDSKQPIKFGAGGTSIKVQ